MPEIRALDPNLFEIPGSKSQGMLLPWHVTKELKKSLFKIDRICF